MDIITVERLKKHFRVAQKKSGLTGLFSSLVHPEYKTVRAVDDISFRFFLITIFLALGT